MHGLLHQLSMMRRQRAAVFRFLALTAVASLGACDGGDDPVAPTDDPPAPGGEAFLPDPASITTGQRILFTSARKGGYDIYRTDPQGSGAVRLTSFTGDEHSPAWSWDNKRIAMVRSRLGSDNINAPTSS